MIAWGLLIIRLIVGLTFAGHGAQKLFGWFGGPGIKGTAGWLGSMNVKPALPAAIVTGLFELLGGLLFAAGILTPVAALMITVTMIGAIVTVHGKNGFWATANGFEYNLILIAVVIGVGLTGPGAYHLF
ncbi:DoxX family protein [Paenibacillus sp. KQZ6P-2]|uniref:DoxX family protein n=1 Tax=Paenibacillus mangrovi TaxID=2931978 RepID=A0A9X1WNB3_9BACL|nr:DoxX family protein [Paenibacillus mangrovi]MCJ8010738.1 DoxX family protein [Paenibacillus mangrovi]